MENICIRLDAALAKQIARDMAEMKYSTKTEFIREAIRDKLKANRRERGWEALFAARGALKGKSRFKSYDEWHDWRSGEGSRMIEEHYNKKFGLSEK